MNLITLKNKTSETSNTDVDRVLRYSFTSILEVTEEDLMRDDVLDLYSEYIKRYKSASWVTFELPKGVRVITISGVKENCRVDRETDKIYTSIFVDSYIISSDDEVSTISINDDENIII